MMKWMKYAIPALAAVLVIGGLANWGTQQSRMHREYKAYMDNLYQKSYYELVGHVQNIQTDLEKLAVSGDPEQNWMLLSSVWRHADSAQQNLGQLPELGAPGSDMSQYLNQVSDFCRGIMQRLSRRQPIDIENQQVLDSLLVGCVQVVDGFNTTAPPQGEQAIASATAAPYESIQETSIEYPHIIYDGPFSETRLSPDLTYFLDTEIDVNAAQAALTRFLGEGYAIERGPDTQGDVSTYGFYATAPDGTGRLYAAVSVMGGRVLTLMWDGAIPAESLSVDEAYRAAIDLVAARGFTSMEPLYRQKEPGMLLVTFAYKQDGAVCYPDQLKVQVSLADGSVMGWEATNYYMAHHTRDIPDPAITADEAQALLRQGLTVISRRLAVIPLDSGKEVLCYEFKVDNKGQTYLIYLNADTGHEEQIFKLLENESGLLTIKDDRRGETRL